MSEIQMWLPIKPNWTENHRKFLRENEIYDRKAVNMNEVIQKSDCFAIPFPLDVMRIKTLQFSVDKHILERNVQSAYPLLHESVLKLIADFLQYKQENGTAKERDIYANMTILDFIDRLLNKRAVTFICKNDEYVLRDGYEQFGNWESIGTEKEQYPLILKDYLSYDEMKISVFLSVSSYTHFINDGSRYNNGKLEEDRQQIQNEGVIIGLIGTRLEKKYLMEFQEIVITNRQNTIANEYGHYGEPTLKDIFANFYEENTFLYDNVRYAPVQKISRFKELYNGDFFDNVLYAKRLTISFDTLLIEANDRAQKAGKLAYIHVVGIGLGVWRLSTHQEDIFVDTFGTRISVLGRNLNNISDIHFAFFPRAVSCSGYKDGDLFPIQNHSNGGINIFISEREPHTKLKDSEKLLVVTYAWAGNSLPGNEFWKGYLGNSGDSAAATSTQISELHNPLVNENVCVNNLMIATSTGLISIQEYFKQIQICNL